FRQSLYSQPKSIEDILTSLKNTASSSNIPQYTKADKELVIRCFQNGRIVEGEIINLARYSKTSTEQQLIDHQNGWKEVLAQGKLYTAEDIVLLQGFIDSYQKL